MNLFTDINSDKFITVCVCVTIVLVVISMATCTATSYQYEADITRAETEKAKAEATEETEALRLIRELIDSGVNPIAARCAILGEMGSEQRRLLCAATIGDVKNMGENK